MKEIDWEAYGKKLRENFEKYKEEYKDVTLKKKIVNERMLLENIAKRKKEIISLYEEGERIEEDCIYRYYHESYKVFYLQAYTEEMVNLFVSLLDLADRTELNESFIKLVEKGTGKEFNPNNMHEINMSWQEETRPILEAYFHARYMLKMIVKYGIEQPVTAGTRFLPSGWAAVLYLYNMR